MTDKKQTKNELSEQTRQLFDAPWHVGVCEKGDPEFESVFLAAKTGWLIGRDMDDETAHRLARLPELYDALMEAKNEMSIMLNEWALGKSEVDYLASYRERKGKNNYEFFNGIQELLKKVRNGE